MSQHHVLFITYYFPPSGGSGVQRPLKMVKYLEEFGWTPIVLTVDPEYASYPGLDHSMLEEIPPATEVHRTQSWDPYSMYASVASKKKDDVVSVGFVSDKKQGWKEYLARWIRANLFIPDARRGWVPFALKQARMIIQSHTINAIVTTGPPQSTHLIGKKLKKLFGLPWIADMRDPWTKVYYADQFPTTPIARHFNERMEQSVLDEADLVVTVTPSMQTAFQAQTKTQCVNIYNGFDPADFAELDPPADTQSETFLLSFVGNLMADQNPSALWKAIHQLREQGRLEKMNIHLVGNVDRHVLADIDQAGIMDLMTRKEYVPHHEAVQHMQAGTVLLLPINRGPAGKGILTGKLFEYLATHNPILGIGPVDGDAARVLAETGAGTMLDYEDRTGIEQALLAYYTAWTEGHLGTSTDKETLGQFNRKHQARELAGLLDKLLKEDA